MDTVSRVSIVRVRVTVNVWILVGRTTHQLSFIGCGYMSGTSHISRAVTILVF